MNIFSNLVIPLKNVGVKEMLLMTITPFHLLVLIGLWLQIRLLRVMPIREMLYFI